MKGLHRTKIDYCALSGELIGREGYVLNLITGCKHHQTDICNIPCYARQMVEHGRLRGHPSYPYGFEPTFHPERIRAIGGKPKLIFLNDMGDVGGDWDWKDAEGDYPRFAPGNIAKLILYFAELNPQHILLLLTKNPAWYALADWPENVWCGFSATNNEEYHRRVAEFTGRNYNWWVSLEPWLDKNAPTFPTVGGWVVIGGLTGRNPQPVSEDTGCWIRDGFDGKLFVKDNTWGKHFEMLDLSKPMETQKRREYPESWRIP